MAWLLKGSAVSHQVFHHLPVHKRLPAEEIHFQIHPAAGICHEEVQCLLSHFQTHKRPSAVVFALPRKTVFTCQITVVGNVQAERLYDSLPVFEGVYVILVDILRKKLPLLLQIQDLLHRLLRFGKLHGKLLRHPAGDFFLRFHPLQEQPLHHRDRIVGGLVHHMDAAAVDVHHNMVTVTDILMYHDFSPAFYPCLSCRACHTVIRSGQTVG